MSKQVLKILVSASVLLMGCALKSGSDGEKLHRGLWTTGMVSAYAIDLKCGTELLVTNEAKRLIPASLTKVFTSAAALEVLHENFHFETDFAIIEESQGSALYIKGGGDPTLGCKRWDETREEYIFQSVLKGLRKANVRRLGGGVLVDASLFPGTLYPSKRIWEDMANYYGAPPSAISYLENTFYLTLSSPATIGELCSIVSCEPEIGKHWDCKVRSSAVSKDSAYIYGYPEMDNWYVSGSIPSGRTSFRIKGALPEPPLVLASRLMTYLQENGIEIANATGYAEKGTWDKTSLIYRHYSPSLIEIIKIINKNSHNLFADHLFFQLAAEAGGEPGWEKGAEVLEAFWRSHMDDCSARFYDGSGLSPFNRFSAKDMVGALQYIDSKNWGGAFKTTLSVAGEDGTLKHFFKGLDGPGVFIGKSGSMEGVLGYCGFLKTAEDKELAVCVMVNGFTEPYAELRQKIAELLEDLIISN